AIKVVNVTSITKVSISPTVFQLNVGESRQFTATISGPTKSVTVWAVNGVDGGNSSVGYISASGLYTAPAVVSGKVTVTITAHLSSDSANFATASAVISGQQSDSSQIYSWARHITNGSGDFNFLPDPTLSAPNWGGPQMGSNNVRRDP